MPKLFDSRLLATITYAALLLHAPFAAATTAHAVSLAALVQRSDAVILGRVGERQSFWQGNRIYTRVHIAIEQVWKGTLATPEQIQIILLGGVVGDIGQHVDGCAEMRAQQRVVLHLRERADHDYVPVALAQGVWHVADAEANRDVAVSRPHIDRLVGSPGTSQTQPTTLSQLKRAVLQAARTQ